MPFQQSSRSHVKWQLHRNIWFIPPYSRTVITNVVKKFLQLLGLHFPHSNKFHKNFNGNNVKVSSCCTQNVGNIIRSHNKNLINSTTTMHSHATVGKKKIVHWRGNIALKTNCKCIASTSDHPDKAHWGTAGGFKKI